MQGPDGILLVDKPQGVTSFAVVGRIRSRLKPPGGASRSGGRKFRCGHAGTLDPQATGLLLVLVGRASRLSPFLMGMDKTYTATVRFGTETDTLDREGRVLRRAAAPDDPSVLAGLLEAFRGEVLQVPPVYSALKQDGRPLHRRVRAGEQVAEPEARVVTISGLEIAAVRWDEGIREIDLVVDCGSGTYIRSLARDLGRAAGSAAVLQELRRTRIGPYLVADALGGAMELERDGLVSGLLSPAAALAHLPTLELEAREAAAVLDGIQPDPLWGGRIRGVPASGGAQAGLFAMLDPQGELAAVGRLDPDHGLPRLVAVLGRGEPA